MSFLRFATLAAACLAPTLVVAQDVPLDPSYAKTIQEARALVNAGDPLLAYQVLSIIEPEYAGNIDFDYLYGIAAVGSNHHTEGMFALERVLAVKPDHVGARKLAARAHFSLGEVEASKKEYKNLRKLDPSAETEKVVQYYLSAIDKALGLGNRFTAYLETGLGWDSNISSATNINAVTVPSLGTFQLDRDSREQSTSFLHVGGGAGFKVPANDKVAFIGNLKLAKNIAQKHQEFETSSVDLSAGVEFKLDEGLITFSLQNNHFLIDDKVFRHAYGFTTQYTKNWNEQAQSSAYGQYSKLNYKDNSFRNADRFVLGVNHAHAFQHKYKPVVFGGAYIAQERTKKSNTKFLDQNIFGVRGGTQLAFTPAWTGYLSTGYEHRQHRDDDIQFLYEREDDQYDLTLGLNYTPARYWTVKPKISYIKSDSNIDLYTFDRTTVSVNVRRDFNW